MSLKPPAPQAQAVTQGGTFSTVWTLFFTQLTKAVNGWQPPSFADADAPANTVYYSTTGSKLTYKAPGGTTHALY